MANWKDIMIGLVSVMAGISVGYGVYKLTIKKGLSRPSINFVRGTNGLSFVAAINIKIPATQLQYYKESDRPAIQKSLIEINNKYGKSIAKISKATAVPEALVLSFIFIESRGGNNAVNGNSYGLMQINTTSATDLLHLAHTNNLLTSEIQYMLRKHIGNRLDTILKMQYMNQYGLQVTASDLQQPELNILIGTLYLRLLIDYFTENKTIRLDKVVACYNMGFGWRTKLTGPDYETIEKMTSNLNSITGSYILKLLGKNGTLDILTA